MALITGGAAAAAGAVKGLTAALASNIFGLAAVAVGALIGKFIQARNEANSLAETMKAVGEAADDIKVGNDKVIDSMGNVKTMNAQVVQSYYDVIDAALESAKEQLAAQKSLIENEPAVVKLNVEIEKDRSALEIINQSIHEVERKIDVINLSFELGVIDQRAFDASLGRELERLETLERELQSRIDSIRSARSEKGEIFDSEGVNLIEDEISRLEGVMKDIKDRAAEIGAPLRDNAEIISGTAETFGEFTRAIKEHEANLAGQLAVAQQILKTGEDSVQVQQLLVQQDDRKLQQSLERLAVEQQIGRSLSDLEAERLILNQQLLAAGEDITGNGWDHLQVNQENAEAIAKILALRLRERDLQAAILDKQEDIKRAMQQLPGIIGALVAEWGDVTTAAGETYDQSEEIRRVLSIIAGMSIAGPFARAISFAAKLLGLVRSIGNAMPGGSIRFGDPNLNNAPSTGTTLEGGSGFDTSNPMNPFGGGVLSTLSPAYAGTNPVSEGTALTDFATSPGSFIAGDVGGGAGGGSGRGGGGSGPSAEDVVTLQEYVDLRERQLELESSLYELSSGDMEVREALRDIYDELEEATENYTDAELLGAAERIAAAERELERKKEVERAYNDLLDTVEQSMGDAIMSIIDGTASTEDAFKKMAANILSEIMRIIIMQELIGDIQKGTGLLGGLLNGIFSEKGNAFEGGSVKAFAEGDAFEGGSVKAFAEGDAFEGGSVKAFAKGGVLHGQSVVPFADGGLVSSPTMFPMSGGQTGIMGEAGPEAIMPLKRTKDGRLGVETADGGGNTNVRQEFHFNLSANGDESVRQIVLEAVPTITEAAKTAVIQDRLRGGVMKRAFE